MCYKCLGCESKIASILNLIMGSLVGGPLSCPLSCPLYPYMEVVNIHTKMKSGLPIGGVCAIHGLPNEAVGSSVDRSCPLFM